MPWYEEWTNYRTGEDPKALSVALNEHGTWFHGAAPSLGHAMISIRVDGSFGEYVTITDGIMSVFHHELFHNQQRNISLHFGAKGHISGMEGAWEIYRRQEGRALHGAWNCTQCHREQANVKLLVESVFDKKTKKK